MCILFVSVYVYLRLFVYIYVSVCVLGGVVCVWGGERGNVRVCVVSVCQCVWGGGTCVCVCACMHACETCTVREWLAVLLKWY